MEKFTPHFFNNSQGQSLESQFPNSDQKVSPKIDQQSPIHIGEEVLIQLPSRREK